MNFKYMSQALDKYDFVRTLNSQPFNLFVDKKYKQNLLANPDSYRSTDEPVYMLIRVRGPLRNVACIPLTAMEVIDLMSWDAFKPKKCKVQHLTN
jgi:vacuolar-type H+-ATPase subunit C/Vma6